VHPFHWRPQTDVTDDWYHEMAVTGVEYDAEGKVAALIFNDTGLGVCGLRLTMAQVEANMFPGSTMLVSRDRQW
jgi:hypothetical protein